MSTLQALYKLHYTYDHRISTRNKSPILCKNLNILIIPRKLVGANLIAIACTTIANIMPMNNRHKMACFNPK